MRTTDLIQALAADAATPPKRLAPAVLVALGASVVVAWVVGWMLLPPRPAVDPAFAAIRFPMKFVVTGAFGAAAAALAMRLARPGAAIGAGIVGLVAAASLLAMAMTGEMMVTPSADWWTLVMGRNWLVCLVHVPLLSAIPLVLILAAMRRGAPGSPTALGAAAGLLAGAVGATAYASFCPNDSPLFVGVWYVLAVGFVTLIGAGAGSRLLRW